MSKMQQHRRRQAESAPPKATSGGDRVVEIHAQKDPDPEIQQAIEDHYHGKQSEKIGRDLVAKSKYLQRIVRQRILENRSEDRPKRFEFTGNVLGETHTVKVNVKEGGYQPFEDDVRAEIERLGVTYDEDGKKVGKSQGELFLAKAVTETTNCKIDFSLIPEAKKEEVFDHLMQVNTICGISEKDIEDGKAIPIAEMVYSNVPNSEYQKLRTMLGKKEDRKLEQLTKTPISY